MFGFLPSNVFTTHVGQGDGTGPSPRILASVAGQAQAPDGSERLYEGISDDFDGQFDTASVLTGNLGRFTYSVDSGKLLSDPAVVGGVLNLSSGASSNHESWLKSGVVGSLDSPAASNGQQPLFFEVRANFPSLVGFCFLGLTAPGVVGTDVLTDTTGALPDTNYFGFKVDLGVVSFVAKKTGVTAVTLATDLLGYTSGVANKTNGWHKLGFAWTPRKSSSNGRLSIYTDNVLRATLEDSALLNTGGTYLGAIPIDTPLAGVMGFKNSASAATTLGLDWAYAFTLKR